MGNLLFLTLQFFSILAFGMLWYRLFEWSPEESICMAIVSAISIILVGAYFEKAQIALLVIYALSLIGVFLFIFGRNRAVIVSLPKRVADYFSPGVVLLIFVYLYGIVAFYGLVISNWDEMNQWGKSVRYMLDCNALPFGEGFDGEDVLLSSTTFFHYYFCKIASTFTGEIVESNMYVSNLILWFSAAILPLSGLKWRSWKACLSYAIIVFLSMHVLFVQPYFNIYCDQPLVVWAGAMIAWNYFCEEKKHRRIFIILALLQIAMMKNMMGPLFTVVIVLSLFIKYFMDFDTDFKTSVKMVFRELTVDKIIYAISCVVSVFFLTAMWSLKISDNALVRGDGIIKTGDDRFKLTLKSGLLKWFQPVNLSSKFPNLTFFLFCILVVIIGAWFARKYLEGVQKKEYLVLLSFYEFGFFAFFGVMMYTYLTTFSYADSIITGSLNRYLSDYMMLGFIPLITPAFRGNVIEVSNKTTGWRINAGASLLLLFFALSTTDGFTEKALRIEVEQTYTYKEVAKMRTYRDVALSLMDSDEQIYMINQNSNGILTIAADYAFEDLIDREGMCYYFTSENQNIVGMNYANIKALPEILLNGFGYLWVYNTDSYFDKNAFSVLKIKTPQNGDFYKVENENGLLKLRRLGNILEITDEILDN